MVREARLLWGTVRRFLLVRLRPRYVSRQIRRRRGVCRQCGDCCRIAVRCPRLRSLNHCTVYERRPLQCRMFPIDQRDLRDVPTCAFRFDEAVE